MSKLINYDTCNMRHVIMCNRCQCIYDVSDCERNKLDVLKLMQNGICETYQLCPQCTESSKIAYQENDMWNEFEEASKEPMTSIELREIVWKQGTERFLDLFREQIKIKGKP